MIPISQRSHIGHFYRQAEFALSRTRELIYSRLCRRLIQVSEIVFVGEEEEFMYLGGGAVESVSGVFIFELKRANSSCLIDCGFSCCILLLLFICQKGGSVSEIDCRFEMGGEGCFTTKCLCWYEYFLVQIGP